VETTCDIRNPKAAKWGLMAIATGAAYLALYLVARVLLEQGGWVQAARIGIALMPLPAFCGLLWAFIQSVRSVDELGRRIQLEALAIAFPLAIVLVTTLGLLEIAVPLNRDDWSYRHIWPYMGTFYLLGLWIARRRYL
jgi:hypothetical protein